MTYKTDTEILEAVLDEFAKLAAIPRPSGHMTKISNFLRDYLTAAGFSVEQDEHQNIIADKPAAPGLTNAPLTVLQAHMDMVCAARAGVNFDATNDAIKLVRDEKYLRADNTSLGADDGIGIAVGIYALKNFTHHGALRLIITTDEETNMGGALALDEKYVRDAKYLINCDSENFDELIVGSAGGVDLKFERKISWQTPTKKTAWHLAVSGLKGGHSGERIGDNRGNALHILAGTLNAVNAVAGIELARLDGGKAKNVIPDSAEAVFTSDAKEATLRYIVGVRQEHFAQIYGDADPGLKITLTPAEDPEDVMSEDDKNAVLRLLYLLPTGVMGMSRLTPALVETSANLGIARTRHDIFMADYFPRSSIDSQLNEFGAQAQVFATLVGFSLNAAEPYPAWQANKDSRLARIVANTYTTQNGGNMKINIIHAGLECGFWHAKNRALDIVSVGATTKDIHSTDERLLLSTVAPLVRLIEETLKQIAEE